MAQINKYLPIYKQVEGYGKFTNNPKDSGGPTMSGITLTAYREVYGTTKTITDLRRMTDEQLTTILKRNYWDRFKADQIKNQSVANMVVDFAVNCGPKTAIVSVQKTIGAEPDGDWGPKSMEALNTMQPAIAFYAIKTARQNYYKSLAVKRPKDVCFLKGWLNRLEKIRYSNSNE